MSAPSYLAALDDDDHVRTDALALLARVVNLHETASTDLAEDLWREPADSYCDPHRWAAEIAAVHQAVPLPLALSCELPTTGSYKAMLVAGTPVLITRTPSGAVRAAINSCRHRGAALVPAGTGTAPRLVCPYHSWCYDLEGRLVAVEDSTTFGELDASQHGLVALPVEERCGLVFVGLTPGRGLDLDTWLGPELLHLLNALDLASCHHYSTRELRGPNWKLVLDGYLEGYHVGTAHQDSILNTVHSNRATFDSYGPHMRNGFALRTPVAGADLPRDVSAAVAAVSAVYWLFPGLNISGGWGAQVAVSLVLPGQDWSTSRTEQHILLRNAPHDDQSRTAADLSADRLREVVLDEDYSVAEGIQEGIAGMLGRDFVFGRNEPAVQHFHRTLRRLLAELPS